MASSLRRSAGDELARRAALEGESVRVIPPEAEMGVIPSPAEIADALAARNQAIRLVMAAFGAAIPGKAHLSGHFAAEGACCGEPSILIPDGKYRVIGSEWAGRFEAGRLVEAFRCVPPRFGGDDIEIII